MTSLQLKQKAFTKACNRVRALIAFKKIQTLQQAAQELGLPLEFQLSSDVVATPSVFNEYIKQITPRLEAQWLGPPKLLETQEDFWNTKDALIESTIYQGYKPPKQSRRLQLESHIPKHNPSQKGQCLYFQYDCALEVFNAITQQQKKGILVRANTGDGKTFFAGQLIRWLLDSHFLDDKSFSPWKILYVTGASIVDQSREDLQEHFGLKTPDDLQITNYEALRSSFGIERFLEHHIVVEDGEEHEVWEWRKMIHPCLIIWDECHKLKNEDSIQSKVAQACNNLHYVHPFTQQPAVIYQVFMSASPFSRIAHAKAFAVSTGHKLRSKDGRSLVLKNSNWRSIAAELAAPAELNEYSRVAIRKFLREFKDYIYPFKNVRRKHKAILQTEFLEFLQKEDAQKYQDAWEKFCDFQRKLKGMEYGNSRFLLLVQLQVFRQAAEIIRAFQLAKLMYDSWQKGFAPVAACCFKPTIAKVVLLLTQDFNIPRSKISVIWGGSTAFNTTKEKRFTREQIHEVLRKALLDPTSVQLKTIKAIHSQLQAEQEGLVDIPEGLRLGVQSREQRNEERRAFQSGQAEFCLFTFGAGKEGLSLHHNEDYLRPRAQFNTPTYNEMEMLQAEGRTARITSLSDTVVKTLVYRNTIEVPVLGRVLAKRKCLNVVLSHGEKEDGYSKEIEEVMKLAGFEDTRDEDVELEEQVFEQLEQENNEETEE